MSFFDRINYYLRKNINDYPAFQVVEVKPEDYVHYQVIGRNDPLICYASASPNESYEIVVFKELQSKSVYSIIRCKVRSDIDEYFESLTEILPKIFPICPNTTTELLQEILDYFRGNLSQNLAHICAQFGLIEYFKQLSQSELRLIDSQCLDSGLTALHIAIRTGRILTVHSVLALSPNLDIVDNEENNALHFAAKTNKDIISKICTSAQSTGSDLGKLINSRNRDTFSPLYLACLNDKPDCVKELLRNGADPNGAAIIDDSCNELREFDKNNTIYDQLNTKYMRNGGTPLHWSNSYQCMEELLQMGCRTDARNFQGQTVLHLMVVHSNLSCVLSLLNYGADVCAKGPNGNTPLHLAVKEGQVAVVQALIIFGADVNLQNSSGDTPRHLAATAKRTAQMDFILYILDSVGAKRCPTNRSNCTDGCSQSMGSNFNGIASENMRSKPNESLCDDLLGQVLVKEALDRKKAQNLSMNSGTNSINRCRVLCLDGGGIRGLVTVQMLWVLERMSGKRIVDGFDWISGTSTGSIIALYLAMGHSVHECRKMYFQFKNEIFVGVRPYDSEPLDRFFQKGFGDDRRMADIQKHKIMITSLVADRFPPDLQLFRNYESPNEILGFIRRAEPKPDMPKPKEQLIWKAARSSGAAPTFFRPCGPFLDGGLISNNPTLDTLTEIHLINKALKKVGRGAEELSLDVVVSLGTGTEPIRPVPVIDFYKPDSVMSVGRLVRSTTNFFQLLVEQSVQSEGQVVERGKAWCSSIDVPFFRLNPALSELIPLNESDNIRLVNMLWETTAYLYSHCNEVKELIELLFY